jgi:hypothetical protein
VINKTRQLGVTLRIEIVFFLLAAFSIFAGGLMVTTGISEPEERLTGIMFSLGAACGVLGVLFAVIGNAIRNRKTPDNSSH